MDRLSNAKAHQLERLKTRSLLFRGPGKEILGANERRPVVIQSTCEVGTIIPLSKGHFGTSKFRPQLSLIGLLGRFPLLRG